MSSPLDPAAVVAALPGASRVVVVPRTASTSTDLATGARTDPAAWPDGSVLVADHQAAGRGRAGRTWETPPGTALTVSVLLRPTAGADRLGWVPLLTGLAVVRAVNETAGVRAAVKWPNDVLVPAPDGAVLEGWGAWRKVAGVLAEVVVPDGAPAGSPPAVVVGVGVNVAQAAEDLPVPSAASLRGVGADVDRTTLLGVLVRHLLALDDRWRAGDPSLGAEVGAVCATLGAAVSVDLPGGRVLTGTAAGLADDGALVVVDAAGRRHEVHAGDVRHVRAAGAQGPGPGAGRG
ncbi:biotin--[acetyl-CoA-carboxylase] ligase [Actinotalea solisilvae]|uniref:biotin--[acetyl-CoA-carboxylase] ligase n=1 Tax=Actinotalea solisilvae TaxID=2072922 RepID=UPI0018F159E5|nr:biotin--[acetyl-CoA-carboxylase] ligase [Actinotalea solisilvae]